jgi:hypothetical protein
MALCIELGRSGSCSILSNFFEENMKGRTGFGIWVLIGDTAEVRTLVWLNPEGGDTSWLDAVSEAAVLVELLWPKNGREGSGRLRWSFGMMTCILGLLFFLVVGVGGWIGLESSSTKASLAFGNREIGGSNSHRTLPSFHTPMVLSESGLLLGLHLSLRLHVGENLETRTL